MSNMYDEYDEYEPEQRREMTPKALRELHEADQALIREMREELAEFRKERTIEKVERFVESKGLEPDVKGLIPDGEKDPVGWLAKHEALFAKRAAEQSNEAPSTPAPVEAGGLGAVPASEQQLLGGIAQSAAGAVPKAGLDALETQMTSFDNADDLVAWLRTQK